MNLREQGAYRNILDAMWMAGGSLLNTETVLRHASGCRDAREWRMVRDRILAELQPENDGKTTTHRRIKDQLATVERLQNARTVAANTRWNQQKGDANASAKPMPTTTTTTTTTKTKERAMTKNSPPKGCTKHPTSGITDKGDCYGCYAELASKRKPPCPQHPGTGITDKGVCYGCYRESFTPVPSRAN